MKHRLLSASVLTLLCATAGAQSAQLVLPDLSALSKKASDSVNITLDASLLSLASGLLGGDADSKDPDVKNLIAGLKGVYVRSYKFDSDWVYSKADLDAVRAQLAAPAWTPLVSTHDRKQQSDVDIFINHAGGRAEGMAIISSTPRELTLVNIVGSIDLAKLAQLQGQLGIPKLSASIKGAAPSSGGAPAPAATPPSAMPPPPPGP